ncbi:Abi family protein [Terrabacter aeriphilus]|uniref:Abi family protein n=1 Tax=Terrabacter aeriphilus TaxID=515662 RepID=A0ABP9JMP8_9MICO
MTTPASDPYDLGQLLERRISAERFGRYRRAVPGGDSDAAALYVWNAEVASAFGLVIGQFEVILRNALNEQMVARQVASGRPGEWYDDRVTLNDPHRHDDVAKARSQILNAGKTETPGLMVAELMFGFWRFLLGPRHQTTLWAQSLRHAFPYLSPQRRSDVYDPVQRLNKLRNRMAHHEPVYAEPLADDHDQLLTVAGYIDPEAEAWLRDLSRVPALLDTRPALLP